MRSELLWILLLSAVGTQAQQCTQPALPNVIPPLGGDAPSQADGIWYIYRVMGRPVSTNPRVQFNTVGQIVDPISGLPAFLQWRSTALQPNSNGGTSGGYGSPTSSCQNQFWTGQYLVNGQEIGDEGTSDKNYIMVPTQYTVLYHDYQTLMIHYSCAKPGANGICASPIILVETRVRADKLLASQAAAFDATITAIFSKYCVTLDNVPKNTFTDSSPECPFIDPPPCVAADIQGMKNSQPPSGPVTGSPAPPSGCKWPVSIPAPANIDPNLLAGNFYVYRRVYAPEASPVNQVVLFTNTGAAAMPLSNITGRTYTVQYAQYASLTSTQCANGFLVFIQGSNGVMSGLIIPYTANGAPQPISLSALSADGNTILYYGCEQTNAQTGQCDKPTVVHMIKTNPLQMSQYDKDAADALENSFFSKFGCSASGVQQIPHTVDKPPCPFIDPPECMQKHIDGYKQVSS